MTIGTKYTFVCDPDNCDTLIEVTCPSGFDFPNGVVQLTCPCGRRMQYISATIQPSTNEREQMFNNNDEQVKALTEHRDSLASQVERLQNQISTDSMRVRLYNDSVNSLRAYLVDNYNDLEMHAESIAEIFDISLKREVTVNFVIHCSATVEVEAGFTVDDLLTDNIYVDANHGDIVIDDYSVEDIQEV